MGDGERDRVCDDQFVLCLGDDNRPVVEAAVTPVLEDVDSDCVGPRLPSEFIGFCNESRCFVYL